MSAHPFHTVLGTKGFCSYDKNLGAEEPLSKETGYPPQIWKIRWPNLGFIHGVSQKLGNLTHAAISMRLFAEKANIVPLSSAGPQQVEKEHSKSNGH